MDVDGASNPTAGSLSPTGSFGGEAGALLAGNPRYEKVRARREGFGRERGGEAGSRDVPAPKQALAARGSPAALPQAEIGTCARGGASKLLPPGGAAARGARRRAAGHPAPDAGPAFSHALPAPEWLPALRRHPALPCAQIRDLNRGAFGFVVLAHDKQCNDRVALKFIERGPEVGGAAARSPQPALLPDPCMCCAEARRRRWCRRWLATQLLCCRT